MPHRHLTLEQYERALEEDRVAAMRMRERAARCRSCATALAQSPLAPLLAAWALPAGIDRPVDWRVALRRATAPSRQRIPKGRSLVVRLILAACLLVGLTFATTLQVAASSGPGSVLYPVRGMEEDARWRVTPEPDKASLEADLATAYLWQARTSASHHDRAGYDEAMHRFFTWAGRLKADIFTASPAQRSGARETVRTALSLVPPLVATGPDPDEAHRAQSVMEEVEVESEAGDRQHGNSQPSNGARTTSGAQGQQSQDRAETRTSQEP